MKIRTSILLLWIFVSPSLCFAEEMDRKTQLVIEYLELSNTRSCLEASVHQTVNELVSANPSLSKDKLLAFFNAYMGWDKMQGPIIRITSNMLTNEELMAINAFYRTEIGASYAAKSPALSGAISEAMTQNMFEVLSKLQQPSQ